MSVNIRKVQLLVSHYYSVLVFSKGVRKSVDSLGLDVIKEINSSRVIGEGLRKLEARGVKVI